MEERIGFIQTQHVLMLQSHYIFLNKQFFYMKNKTKRYVLHEKT